MHIVHFAQTIFLKPFSTLLFENIFIITPNDIREMIINIRKIIVERDRCVVYAYTRAGINQKLRVKTITKYEEEEKKNTERNKMNGG